MASLEAEVDRIALTAEASTAALVAQHTAGVEALSRAAERDVAAGESPLCNDQECSTRV